jgi:hypothetical protein
LKSGIELETIILEINRLLPQLTEFIEKFNSLVVQNGINVITDVNGNMSMDVPTSMSDATYTDISNRIGIIDRLINSHGASINELFQKASAIETQIKQSDSTYTSQLTNQIMKFKELNASYKH